MIFKMPYLMIYISAITLNLGEVTVDTHSYLQIISHLARLPGAKVMFVHKTIRLMKLSHYQLYNKHCM